MKRYEEVEVVRWFRYHDPILEKRSYSILLREAVQS